MFGWTTHNPETRGETSEIITKPPRQFARKSPPGPPTTLEPLREHFTPPQSSGDPQERIKSLEDVSEIPRCWTMHLIKINKPNGQNFNHVGHIMILMGGSSASLTNPQNSRSDKRKINNEDRLRDASDSD